MFTSLVDVWHWCVDQLVGYGSNKNSKSSEVLNGALKNSKPLNIPPNQNSAMKHFAVSNHYWMLIKCL